MDVQMLRLFAVQRSNKLSWWVVNAAKECGKPMRRVEEKKKFSYCIQSNILNQAIANSEFPARTNDLVRIKVFTNSQSVRMFA